jgi:pyridoxine kinase
MTKILSIQSQVTFGHVGNAAVTFPLQLLVHQVWPVPTTALSNHAGYRGNGGTVLAAETVRDILDGLVARDVFAQAGLVLTGYLGSVDVGAVVQAALGRSRDANPDAIHCCDPVLGDRDVGIYVADGLVDFFADLAVSTADLLTPNHFELGVLSGQPVIGAPVDASLDAARRLLRRMRPGGCVLVTSFEPSGVRDDRVAMLAVTADRAWIVETPRLSFTLSPHGAGDLAAALFAAHYVETGDPGASLADMAARLHAVLSLTAKQDSAELELVASRGIIVSPPEGFEVRPCV